MKETELVRDLVVEVAAIAAKLGIEPRDLNKTQFLKNSSFKEWQIRKVGGLATLKNTYFPQQEKDLKMIQLNKQREAELRKLEAQAGKTMLFHDQFVADVAAEIAKLNVTNNVLNKTETKKFLDQIRVDAENDNEPRSIVSIWSDQHFGTSVESEEVLGQNAFNWPIGARRLGMLCQQIAEYKIEKRYLHEELVILLLGDNIAGVIHDQEGGNDLISSQCAGAASYYTQALDYLKNFFPKIRVICQPGNHGRMMHKMSKDRAVSKKWDSYENMIFHGLSNAFRGDPQIVFETTKAPVSDIMIQGHRIYATHGDTVFETGNVGKSINLSRIEAQIARVNMEAADKGQKQYEMFCTGHVHHPVLTHIGPGVKVVINGCLVGTDTYAHAVGIHSNTPAQVLWECTKNFVQGDVRQIYVAKADTNPEYEKIITPYKYELSVPKLTKKSLKK